MPSEALNFPAAASEPAPSHGSPLHGATARSVEAAPGQPLPAWAANSLGRELVAQILADPPGYRVHDACGFKVVEFGGVPAYRLRRLFERESDRLMVIADAEHAAGKPWIEASRSWTSFMHGEKPDDLIARLLRSDLARAG